MRDAEGFGQGHTFATVTRPSRVHLEDRFWLWSQTDLAWIPAGTDESLPLVARTDSLSLAMRVPL